MSQHVYAWPLADEYQVKSGESLPAHFSLNGTTGEVTAETGDRHRSHAGSTGSVVLQARRGSTGTWVDSPSITLTRRGHPRRKSDGNATITFSIQGGDTSFDLRTLFDAYPAITSMTDYTGGGFAADTGCTFSGLNINFDASAATIGTYSTNNYEFRAGNGEDFPYQVGSTSTRDEALGAVGIGTIVITA